MIRTSYFAKYKESNGVSISAITPSWFKGCIYRQLAPPKELVTMYKQGMIDESQYTEIYTNNVLNHLNPKKIYDDLNDHVLLCYEKSNEFCHRHIVAEWLKNKLGVLVIEL